jgi:branched-chain amino acid transport system substrate-binding protein
MKKFALVTLLVLISLVATACGPTAAPFECTDAIGCVTIAPGDPVRIGYALVLSGPNESLGIDSRNGIEIAVGDNDTEILGHPIELVGEDSMCSAEGGQTALTKLAADPSLIGIIGTNCSSAGEPASRIASDAGMVLLSPSNTAPSLTNPDLAWNPGYFRICHNDNIQGAAMAKYVYDELGARTAATIHDGSPYADQLQEVFANTFKGMGGTITAQEAVSVGEIEMGPILTTIAADAPDFLYYPIFIPEGAQITRKAGEIDGLENTTLAGADGMYSPDFIEAAGDASEGMYISGPNLAFDNPIYDHFLEVHTEKYGIDPLSVFHAQAYDGTMMLLAAVEKVAVQDEDGTLHIGRQAIRDALYGTKDFDGITGSLTCDQYGDCADPEIAVNQITNGEYVPLWTYVE